MNHSDDRQDFELLGLDVLPDDWKYIPLGELVDSKRGISYGIVQPGEHVDDGVPIVRVNNLQSGRIESIDIMKVSYEIEKKYQRTRLKGGEVLLSLVGSLGQTAVVSKEILGWNVARAIAVIPVAPEISPEWVNFALRSPLLQHYIRVWATTTVQATLNLGDVVRLPIPIPPEKERKAIVDILCALDDKIELNRRTNRTLESMARVVFRQWFVESEEVRKWKIGYLSDIAYIVRGVSYRSIDLVEDSDTALVTLKSMERGGGYKEDGLKPYVGEYKPEQKLSPGEVVIAHTDLTQAADVIGKAARIETSEKHPNLVASLDMAIVRPKGEPYTNEYLYGLLSQVEFSDHAYGYTNGTTVLHLSTKALPEYQFRIPPKNKVEEFSQLVLPMFAKIDNNKKESRTLASLRDTLLPKLMRGEVRVKDVEREL